MINTQDYILESQPFFQETHSSKLERFAKWVHDHPKLIQITRIVLDALSVLAILSAPLGWNIPGLILGGVGLLTLIATEIALYYLGLFGVTGKSMDHRAFKPGQCENGRLFYQGKVPVLSLESDDPYKAGKAQGTLCAEQILKLFQRTKEMAYLPEPHEIPQMLEKMRNHTPKEYLEEMQGLVDGVNQWIEKQNWFHQYPQITLDEVIIANHLADSLYFYPRQEEARQVACTVVIDKNKKSGLVFGRNMDWPSFGVAGTYSLVIHRNYTEKKHSAVEIGIPGMVGTLTGMNDQGFCVAMNVCGKGHLEEEGIPSSFYNRKVLESCQSVEEAEQFVKKHKPLGSYHLTVADEENAQSFHFYQGDVEQHPIRKLEKDLPLITTNICYGEDDRQYLPMHNSFEREHALAAFFDGAETRIPEEKRDLEALIAHGLTLPYVNNVITTHTVVMVPGKKKMRAAFDNSFAASNPLQEVNVAHLMEI